MPATPIIATANYITGEAVAYANPDGTAQLVSTTAPLPVNVSNTGPLLVSVSPPTTTALSASATTTGVVGPFQPVLGRAVVLTLAGTWTGTVKVVRSTDGGATRQPLTAAGATWAQFTGNCCEPVWEESDATAWLYLDITVASGTVNYRLSQ